MTLFDRAVDYAQDVFRNIRGVKESQDLFDDLSDDPADWRAANTLDMSTHPALTNAPIIQRAFDYSKNEFIDYPFENITASRYSDGTVGCWYGAETLETSIFETTYHFIREIANSPDVFTTQKTVIINRRIAMVHCHGLALDLSHKAHKFPWLVEPVNYTQCQALGRRVALEGHPLLRVPSARHTGGINLVVFKPNVLSNARDYCHLQYVYDLSSEHVRVYRGKSELYVCNANLDQMSCHHL